MNIPRTYGVWWDTGKPKKDGFYPARVLGSRRYTGAYPQWFTHILKLEAPRTQRGWLEMTVNLA
jgi:hypothetical protein